MLAASLDIDYLAVSFVRQAADIEEARALLRAAGSDARIVAKIERSEAIPRLDEIVLASDAVMVARGDLGIEVGYAELTGLQKHILQVGAAPRPRHDHGHADDGVDDPEPGADARRSLGRRERRARRQRRRDALRRIRGRQVSRCARSKRWPK